MAKSWPQIQQTTITDQVYRAIRDRIVREQIEAGEFIREQEVSTALGVSRTPVREALARLASEGFIERIPHRGFRLPLQPLKDRLDLYPILSALEMLAGRLALPILDYGDLHRLRLINGKLQKARERREVTAMVDWNNEFHHVFCERSGNRRLCELLDDLRLQAYHLDTWYYSNDDYAKASVDEHAAIIAAVENRDHERALELLEQNYARARQALEAETSMENTLFDKTKGNEVDA